MGKALEQSAARIIVFDHHINPEHFADVICSNPNLASTGELIYSFLVFAEKKYNIPFSTTNKIKDISEAIYSAIYSDSGGFRYSKTNSLTFLIAADLIHNGVLPEYIYENIYNQNTPNRLKLLGIALSKLETYFDSKLVVLPISNNDFRECRATISDVENLSQYPLSVKNSLVGISLYEYEDDNLRVSFRSKGDIDVQVIATKYGGGGHKNAAGCRFETTIEEAKKILIYEFSQI
jgi:phosphoesterase RecJ-like protein